MFNEYLAIIGLWLCQPEVIPAIKNAIAHWYEWRMRNIYIPEGLENYYANKVKQIDMTFNPDNYKRNKPINNNNKKGNKKK